MKYEKLIFELRHYFEGVLLVMEAADAIEELSKRHECPCWYGDMRFCSLLGKTLPKPPMEEK